ncbi:glycosyltransferase family 2 protein, partial [Candidatus Sumerlaeota bacterium]|nr:glycosyltransferase family 2 protein [Candidatus Sumerlaeota bacterium]
MPRVSVIIPVFNRKEMVKEAISSVLNQTFRDFELIVVDDGSTDGTAEVVKSFNEVRYIRQEHKGPASARNTGIMNAEGELIAFLDSDDLWLPEKLEKQVSYLDHHKGMMICQTEEIWLWKGRRIKPKRKHRKQKGDIFHRAVELCLISPSAVMMRRQLFDQVGLFDETFPAAEDYELWLRVTSLMPVGLIDEELVIKRGGHEGQLSIQSIGILDRYRIRALVKLLREWNLSEEQRRY